MLPYVQRILRTHISNFTCFGDIELDFAAGLNVFIGENGTGKSHLLKLLYATLRGLELDDEALRTGRARNKAEAETYLADRLMGVFRPDSLGRLARRVQGHAVSQVDITLDAGGWDEEPADWEVEPLSVRYAVSSHAKKKVRADDSLPAIETSALFLPTREVISFFPGFIGLFDRYEVEFDETYRDLCTALATAKVRRGRRDEMTKLIVGQLENRLDARILLDDGRFYVDSPGLGKIEAHLVAEGLRKLATLMYLVLNGSMTASTILFWDEPEASLNPKYISVLVDMLRDLANAGVQVFLASHDYLLTQKLSLLAERAEEGGPGVDARFFVFRQTPQGVDIESAPTLLDVSTNPIADEFSEHYAEEVGAMQGSE